MDYQFNVFHSDQPVLAGDFEAIDSDIVFGDKLPDETGEAREEAADCVNALLGAFSYGRETWATKTRPRMLAVTWESREAMRAQVPQVALAVKDVKMPIALTLSILRGGTRVLYLRFRESHMVVDGPAMKF